MCSPSSELSLVYFPIFHLSQRDCSFLHHVSPSPVTALKLQSMVNLACLSLSLLCAVCACTLSPSIIMFSISFHFLALQLITPERERAREREITAEAQDQKKIIGSSVSSLYVLAIKLPSAHRTSLLNTLDSCLAQRVCLSSI